ncbi:MAG: hypothetical protein LQ338_002970 [Usnochroma carphineum]|nr:MAG: hypothetical protein LQ338_002970 [Usnochroma carphineum]
MADVRSMLRTERASRRITHPHITYSSTGTLICTVCHVQIKTEALWNKHLNSTLHYTNLQKLARDTSRRSQDVPAASDEPNSVNKSKKRKADDESSDEDTRKRTKAFAQPTAKDNGKTQNVLADKTENGTSEDPPGPSTYPDSTTNGIHSLFHPPNPPPEPAPTIDESEWAAFQRDVATPPPEPSALTATADISAAPMTAAELAAQSREQASRQAKERLEAEVEGEKEDAARQMEEEFEEMAELEDRVRRLREKREQLRAKEKQDGTVTEVERPPEGVVENVYVSDGGSSGDEEGEDGWGGWGR